MPRRLLIANRGEIALRIARACRELGIESVAAHSRVDANQRHLDMVDATVCISESSYIDGNSIIAAALSRNCDSIHPGYGMLSENAEFAASVEAEGITFIGPRPETVAALGDKVVARRIASEHGLPVLPGSVAALVDVKQACAEADDAGYPVMLKAAYGGGGRGMRIVESAAAMPAAFAEASAEGEAAFGHAALYLEKYLPAPRHVEVQVLGDGAGHAIHLGTRECSIQRRHQKLIEEAPSVAGEPARLAALANQCADVAAALSYRSAGTFEFLFDQGNFYFIEANTRIQVEHPVTEMLTGLDIVKAQLELAETGSLPWKQSDIEFTGHAIECRINAEYYDPVTGRLSPSPGDVRDYSAPGGPGVRVDSHLYNGYRVPHHYDSLLGKLVAWGHDRPEAVARMARALDELRIRGIDTNIDLMRQLVTSEEFGSAQFDTTFVDNFKPAN